MNQENTQPKFSIRKSAIVGGVSVIIALLLVWGFNQPKKEEKKEQPKVEQKAETKTETKKEETVVTKNNDVNETAINTTPTNKLALNTENKSVNVTNQPKKEEKKDTTNNAIIKKIDNAKVGDVRETKEENGKPYFLVGEEKIVYEYDNTKLTAFSYTKSEATMEKVRDIFDVTYLNGEEIKREIIRTETLEKAKPKVIVVGTIVETTKEVPGETFTVEKDTEYVESESLLVGETEEQFAGENGLSRKVYDVVYHNGEEVSRKERTEVVKLPKNRVVAQGVKEVKTTVTTQPIEKGVILTEDVDMLESATPIITKQGENGEKEITTTETYIRGKKVDTKVSEKVLKEQKPEERTVGVLSYTEKVENVIVPKTTVEEKDTSMFEGETRTIEEGEDGENRVTYTEKRIKGQVVSTTVKETEEVRPMKPKKVATGSIVRTFERTPNEVDIEITTKEVESEDLLVGQTEEQFAGEKGIKEVTTVVEKHDGVIFKTTTEERVVKEMKQRIVLVGVKEVEVSETEEPILVTDEISYDESRLTSTPDEVTEGTQGVTTVRTTKTKIRGDVVKTDVERIEKTPMTTRKVVKGSKQLTEKAVTRTIKFVDKLGNDLQAPTIQTLNFTKTSWVNKPDIVWEEAKTFESMVLPTFEKYETTETVPTLSVTHDSQDTTLTIRYANKTVEEVENVSYTLKHWVSEGNRYRVLGSEPVSLKVTKVKDLVTNEYVSTTTQPINELVEAYKIDDIRYTFEESEVSNKDIIFYYNLNEVTNTQLIDFFMEKNEEQRQELATKPDNKLSAVELTQTDLDYLYGKLDLSIYRNELVRLINEERALKGITTQIQLADDLLSGTQTRADEQARIGYLRSIDENSDGMPDKAHHRPDGTIFRTAFNIAHTNLLSENIGQNMTYWIEKMISEKELAKYHFEQFKSSPNHYANMIDENLIYANFAFQFTDAHLLSKQETNGQSAIFVQIFGADGYNRP